ncbi:MAG: hypothetical protein ACW99A_13725, partial [Candidatus Kariarchaeaceae archaeon]
MRIDDNAPAEYLFGKLASDFLNVPTSPRYNLQLSPTYIKRFNFMLSFYLILEFASGVMILSSIMLRDQQLQYFALFVILKLITTAQKNKILTDRFAPDLIAYNSTKFSFAFVQLLLSGIVFLGFGITLFAASSLIPDMDLLDRTKLVGL